MHGQMHTLLVLTTFGWSPQLVTPTLTNRLAEGATIKLVITHLDPGSDKHAQTRIRNALEEVQKLAQLIPRLEIAQIAPIPRPSGPHAAAETAEQLANTLIHNIQRHRPERIDIIAAGGPRLLTTAAALLAATSQSLCNRLRGYIVLEDQPTTEYPIPAIPPKTIQGERKASIARLALQQGEIDYAQAATQLGIDESTVRRLAQELAREGLLDCTRTHRRITCSPTPSLRLLNAAEQLAAKACKTPRPSRSPRA